MSSLFFGGKLRQIPTTFMKTFYRILIRTTPFHPENKCIPKPPSPLSEQVAINPMVNFKMNSSFQPIKEGICHIFRHLGFQIKIIFLLALFVMFKFSFMLYFHQSLVYIFHFLYYSQLTYIIIMFLSCLFMFFSFIMSN